MKESHDRQLIINDFDVEVIMALVHWIYTNTIPDTSVDLAIELLQASNLYMADVKLKELCGSLIIKVSEGNNLKRIPRVWTLIMWLTCLKLPVYTEL